MDETRNEPHNERERRNARHRYGAVPTIHLDRRYRTADVIACIRDLGSATFPLPRPNKSAIVRAQEVALASGAPDRSLGKVILMPSQRGGVIVVFVLDQKHFTICELNNRTTLAITGRDWARGVESVSHVEAIERVRSLRG